MPTADLETPAWLLRGLSTYGAKAGTLRLERGVLSFRENGVRTPTFEIPVTDIADVRFPFYNLGSVVRLDAGGARYRLAFLASQPRFKSSGARMSDFLPARRWGKQWKAALADR